MIKVRFVIEFINPAILEYQQLLYTLGGSAAEIPQLGESHGSIITRVNNSFFAARREFLVSFRLVLKLNQT